MRTKAKCKLGCDSPVVARGWCWKHYQRNRRHGSPKIILSTGGHHKPKIICPCGNLRDTSSLYALCADCRKRLFRIRYKKNPEKYRKINKAWRKKHGEEYRRKNKRRLRAYRKKYYRKHIARIRKYAREHRGIMNECTKRYYRRNRIAILTRRRNKDKHNAKYRHKLLQRKQRRYGKKL